MKHQKLYLLFGLLLIPGLLLASCAAPTPAPTAAPTQASTQVPTQAATTMLVSATPASQTEAPFTLTVLAAASLTESFTEIGTLFEAQHPGVTVGFNFAGSQALEAQLAQVVEADVFASASPKYMTAAIETDKRVNADDSKTFVTNRLAVIFPRDNPAGISVLKDLAQTGLKLDLADKAVPVGQYALDFLDKASADAAYGADFKEKVLANVVSYEENVKAVVTKVSLGEADAGIVYVTDITADAASKVGTLDIPDALNTIASYPIAPIADSQHYETAKAFVDFVLSAEGQAVLAKYGFVPEAGK